MFPSDYITINRFDELIREIIYGVRIRKRNNNAVSILDSRLNTYFENSSFIFLDGVLIDHLDEIIDFGTNKIDRIDVINSTWIIDNLSIPGILSVFTRENEIGHLKNSSKNHLVYPVGEYLPRTKFAAPEYNLSNKSNRTPDFRQLLYWNPQEFIVNGTSKVFSFFTSDLCADYLVAIEGITLNGKPISASVIIKVRNAKNN